MHAPQRARQPSSPLCTTIRCVNCCVPLYVQQPSSRSAHVVWRILCSLGPIVGQACRVPVIAGGCQAARQPCVALKSRAVMCTQACIALQRAKAVVRILVLASLHAGQQVCPVPKWPDTVSSGRYCVQPCCLEWTEAFVVKRALPQQRSFTSAELHLVVW